MSQLLQSYQTQRQAIGRSVSTFCVMDQPKDKADRDELITIGKLLDAGQIKLIREVTFPNRHAQFNYKMYKVVE